MMMHGSVWTDDDLKRLAAIVAAGGTPLRASAALRRSIATCRNQAKKIGTPFTPMQIVRKNIRPSAPPPKRRWPDDASYRGIPNICLRVRGRFVGQVRLVVSLVRLRCPPHAGDFCIDLFWFRFSRISLEKFIPVKR
jgi:hypothetical protein